MIPFSASAASVEFTGHWSCALVLLLSPKQLKKPPRIRLNRTERTSDSQFELHGDFNDVLPSKFLVGFFNNSFGFILSLHTTGKCMDAFNVEEKHSRKQHWSTVNTIMMQDNREYVQNKETNQLPPKPLPFGRTTTFRSSVDLHLKQDWVVNLLSLLILKFRHCYPGRGTVTVTSELPRQLHRAAAGITSESSAGALSCRF